MMLGSSGGRVSRLSCLLYLFCKSGQLRDKPFSQRILGRQLVAYRTASGQVTVMDGHCAHLGADLGCGTVVGETIQCPFHHWRYGADGVCTSIPHATQIPPFARFANISGRGAARHCVFLQWARAVISVAVYSQRRSSGFCCGKGFSLRRRLQLYMNSAHAFDTPAFRGRARSQAPCASLDGLPGSFRAPKQLPRGSHRTNDF